MVRVVCVFGAMRTGSSRVISQLTAFEGLFVKEEIFNPVWAVSLEQESAALAAYAGIPEISGSRDPGLIGWLRENPGPAIEWLLERAGGRVLVFKLFRMHIADPGKLRALLTRDDIGFLVVRRPPLDQYISLLKSEAAKAMRYADTTAIEVTGDASKYLALETALRAWYQSGIEFMKRAGRPYVEISYAREIAQPDAVLRAALATKLRALGVDAGTAGAVQGPELVRQDKGDDYAKKMSNWTAFRKELTAFGGFTTAFAE